MRQTLVVLVIASAFSSTAAAEQLLVGNVDLGPLTYPFSGADVLTHALRLEWPSATTHIDFLIGGNGQGAIQFDVFATEVGPPPTSVLSQTFSTPNTGALPTDAQLISIPFSWDVPLGTSQNFVLAWSAVGGAAYLAQGVTPIQVAGGTGISRITTFPLTDNNQGTPLAVGNFEFRINYQIHGTLVPEPASLTPFMLGVAAVSTRRRPR